MLQDVSDECMLQHIQTMSADLERADTKAEAARLWSTGADVLRFVTTKKRVRWFRCVPSSLMRAMRLQKSWMSFGVQASKGESDLRRRMRAPVAFDSSKTVSSALVRL